MIYLSLKNIEIPLIYSTGAYTSVEREDASEEREKYDKDMKELRQQPS